MRFSGKWQLVASIPRTTYATFYKLKPEFDAISNSGFYYLLWINNRTYLLNGQRMIRYLFVRIELCLLPIS